VAVEILWRAAGKRDELLQAKHLLAWRLPVLRPVGYLEVHGTRNKNKYHYKYLARQDENALGWTAAITRQRRNYHRTNRNAEDSP
jgi:hypothetical protein